MEMESKLFLNYFLHQQPLLPARYPGGEGGGVCCLIDLAMFLLISPAISLLDITEQFKGTHCPKKNIRGRKWYQSTGRSLSNSRSENL
jgi:hypothetical protein